MTAGAALGGALYLRAGVARPDNLRSTRADWAGRLSPGRPAARLPDMLGALFSLCGHAHRRCATLAVTAAQGSDVDLGQAARLEHAQQTLREHLRCLYLDWPRQWAPAALPQDRPEALGALLATCSLFSAGRADRQQLVPWLETHLTGVPLPHWLAAWEADPQQATAAWCERAATAPARWLLASGAAGELVLPSVAALQLQGDAQALRHWAADLQRAGSAMTREPVWRGHCAETGLWTRLNEAHTTRLNTPGLRLAARVAEIVRLALPSQSGRAGGAWLDMGVLPLGPGRALAWLEMSRGLLMHQVQLAGTGEAAQVAACQVVAPTEWNCHPEGAVARVLERWQPSPSPSVSAQALAVVMAAYDPCVPYTLESTQPEELAHA